MEYSYGAQQTQLGAGEEQQDRHSFSDLDTLMTTLGFSDISLSGFLDQTSFLAEVLDPATPTLCQERRKENSGSSLRQGSHKTDDCALVQDDPHTEVTERPWKRRNQAQSHSFTEKILRWIGFVKLVEPKSRPNGHRTHSVLDILRRREKIKSKLKVLQELVPNSQKLDKASLLENAISHIKTLQLQLQSLQEMSSYPYLHAPPMQYATATQSSPFVSPIPSNMNFETDPNANMSTYQPHLPLGIPHSLPFWPVAGNFMSMPCFLPPNPYFQPPATITFQQPQFPEMAPHASFDEHKKTEGTVNGNEMLP